jgi:hypothetical protein
VDKIISTPKKLEKKDERKRVAKDFSKLMRLI